MIKKLFKPLILAFSISTAMFFSSCSAKEEKTTASVNPREVLVTLEDNNVKVEYGSETGLTDGVTTTNDIIYYEDRDTYESGNPYGEGEKSERHTADEANANTVVNISKAGTYRISGTMTKGQIRVDLGEDAFADPTEVVTLILDNADITCDVAPAILFMNVYECDNEWSAESAKSAVDTSSAGANIIIADDSTNKINGSHVAKIFKDNENSKKLWKQDGAVYSYMSMNIAGENEGTGVLDITADNEGLDTELHLTINGGNINICSDNDGINTNEDGVSVTTINGGNIHIIAGLGAEGDGIDSNGWLVINGGTVISSANPIADAGLDSDMGSYINGGTVVALGSTMDWAESDSEQVTMNLQFAEYKASDSAIIVAKEDGTVVFAYDPSEDEVVGENIRQYMGAILSSPDFILNGTYNVFIGGTVEGEENAGIYDIPTVTGFKDAFKQAYTGTDVIGRFGGMTTPGFNFEKDMPDGMKRPEGFEFDGNFPEGMGKGGKFPEGMEIPEGFEFDENGRPPFAEGENMPMMPFPGMGEQEGTGNRTNENTLFFMQDKVNFFTGLADALTK